MVVVGKLLVMLMGGVPGGCTLPMLGMISTEECLCFDLALWVPSKDTKQEADFPAEEVGPRVDLTTCAAHLHGECKRSSG